MERTQAFKLMGKLLVIAPQVFQISFARSLVAVANFNKEDVSKEDPFRKVDLTNHLHLLLTLVYSVAVLVLHVHVTRPGTLQSAYGGQCEWVQLLGGCGHRTFLARVGRGMIRR